MKMSYANMTAGQIRQLFLNKRKEVELRDYWFQRQPEATPPRPDALELTAEIITVEFEMVVM